MLKDFPCFLGMLYNRKWENLCVLVAPRVNPAPTHVCLTHATASNVSFGHMLTFTPEHLLQITNDDHYICVFSRRILTIFWLKARVHSNTVCKGVFWFVLVLHMLLSRYPSKPVAAAVLQLHGTICWWAAVLCTRLRHHTPDTSLWWTRQENGNLKVISFDIWTPPPHQNKEKRKRWKETWL